MISEFDLLVLLNEKPDEFSPITMVADYWTVDVKFIHADTPLSEIATVFRENNVRRLPVLQGKKLVGIVSRRDLIRFLRTKRATATSQPWKPPTN